MSNTVITVSVIAVLVMFAAWALAPAVRANRQRILKSPATWAVVVLLCSVLWMQWEKAQSQKAIKAANERYENLSAVQTYNFNHALDLKNRATDRFVKEMNAKLAQANSHDE